MGDYIQLQERVGDFEEMEVWTATACYNSYKIEGYALTTNDVTDFYDTDPRELPVEDLPEGLRLPAYMPGFKPEEED